MKVGTRQLQRKEEWLEEWGGLCVVGSVAVVVVVVVVVVVKQNLAWQ